MFYIVDTPFLGKYTLYFRIVLRLHDFIKDFIIVLYDVPYTR